MGNKFCEGFIEPEIVPPFHCNVVAEPHVRDLMVDDVTSARDLGLGWGVPV